MERQNQNQDKFAVLTNCLRCSLSKNSLFRCAGKHIRKCWNRAFFSSTPSYKSGFLKSFPVFFPVKQGIWTYETGSTATVSATTQSYANGDFPLPREYARFRTGSCERLGLCNRSIGFQGPFRGRCLCLKFPVSWHTQCTFGVDQHADCKKMPR